MDLADRFKLSSLIIGTGILFAGFKGCHHPEAVIPHEFSASLRSCPEDTSLPSTISSHNIELKEMYNCEIKNYTLYRIKDGEKKQDGGGFVEIYRKKDGCHIRVVSAQLCNKKRTKCSDYEDIKKIATDIMDAVSDYKNVEHGTVKSERMEDKAFKDITQKCADLPK